jgi:hypothetical protein
MGQIGGSSSELFYTPTSGGGAIRQCLDSIVVVSALCADLDLSALCADVEPQARRYTKSRHYPQWRMITATQQPTVGS